MFGPFRRFETALFLRLHRRAPSGLVERGAFWLLLFFLLALILSTLPGHPGTVLAVLFGATLAVFVSILAYRWIFERLLWTVRNRIIVTCLLAGLAPVVLFAILAGIAAYVFSGQFATATADAALDRDLARLHSAATAVAPPLEHFLENSAHPGRLPALAPVVPGSDDTPAHTLITVWRDGAPLPLRSPGQPSRLAAVPLQAASPPPWLRDGFRGIIARDGSLSLAAASSVHGPDNQLLVLATAPLDTQSVTRMAAGLGSISLLPGLVIEAGSGSASYHAPSSSSFAVVQGGTLAPPAHFFDTRVYFSAPLHVIDWRTGHSVEGMLGVVSRPTLLYQRLFASSVRIGAFVRDALIAIAVLFALLELVAAFMAVRLSRTITSSIAELYGATTQINQGNLGHRIRIERHDQLASLATSFNAMTGSLQHLITQQRERERMQNELAIAQEVQNNLFPHAPVHLPGFELHGICMPARTVSGDYYDFIPAGPSRLCLAIGDISGKGISAALLMASLHSAVRAYHAAVPGSPVAAPPVLSPGHLAQSPAPATHPVTPASAALPSTAPAPASAPGFPPFGHDPLFATPARLLSLLNRHLYASTQPSKYATLFVASYDSVSRMLTYSNGGQLPPFLVCADGSVKRLDCGGSVVGLLDNLEYEEATVRLEPGDMLVAYSDGVTEPENDFGEFGEDRLLELIHRNRDQSLAAISGSTLRALQSWIGEAEQPDDITLVLARQL